VKAVEGVYVDKVSSAGQRNRRLLRLSDTGAELQWAKAPFKQFNKGCDLQQVLNICYGHAARAWALYPDTVRPEHCFTLNTPTRSFDFICENDRDVEVLMVAISRACTRSQGWPLSGAIPSLRRFRSARGWCKVQKKCRASGLTLHAHLLAAATAAGASAGRGAGRPPGTHAAARLRRQGAFCN